MKILFSWVFSLLMVLILIPFLTLLERKILRYIQFRKGPKKIGILGVFQPISDGLKLLFKEIGRGFGFKYLIYWFSPILKFLIMVLFFFFFVFIFLHSLLN